MSASGLQTKIQTELTLYEYRVRDGWGGYEDLIRFEMNSIEVDGVVNIRPDGYHHNLMVGVKDETLFWEGEEALSDTGFSWNWDPDAIVDEGHFMKTGNVRFLKDPWKPLPEFEEEV